MIRDVDSLIKKFEAIPENRWIIGSFCSPEGKCALGHLGFGDITTYNMHIDTIRYLFSVAEIVEINDGSDRRYPQATPKQRILAAIEDARAQKFVKYEDITKELAAKPLTEETLDTKITTVIPV